MNRILPVSVVSVCRSSRNKLLRHVLVEMFSLTLHYSCGYLYRSLPALGISFVQWNTQVLKLLQELKKILVNVGR